MTTEKLNRLGLTRRETRQLVELTLLGLFMIWISVAYTYPMAKAGYGMIAAKHRDARDLREQRAATGDVLWAKRLDSHYWPDTDYVLAYGSRVSLVRPARFTVGEAFFSKQGVRAALDGMADIEVNSPQEVMDINTWAGRAWLAPGSYQIICEPGCKRMLVGVAKGVAIIWGDSSSSAVTLHDGEMGAIKRFGQGERIDSLKARQYLLDEWGNKQ